MALKKVNIQDPVEAADLKAGGDLHELLKGRKFTDGERSGRCHDDGKGGLCIRYEGDEFFRALATDLASRATWLVPEEELAKVVTSEPTRTATPMSPAVEAALSRVRNRAARTEGVVPTKQDAQAARRAELKEIACATREGRSIRLGEPAEVPPERAERVAELQAFGRAASGVKEAHDVPSERAERVRELQEIGRSVSR